MALTTVKITGSFSRPDDGFNGFAIIKFTLNKTVIDGSIVVPNSIERKLNQSGEFEVDIWLNERSPDASSYRVDLIYYDNGNYSVPVRSVLLGKIYILNATGQTLQGLIGDGEFPIDQNPPDSTCFVYLFDNSGSDELRVRFSNGTIKTIANDIA